MVFKNLLLGLGGSVAIGGIGYGIYSSSQSNEKEEVKISVQEQKEDKNSGTKPEKEKTNGGAQPTNDTENDSGNTESSSTGDDQESADASPKLQTGSNSEIKDQGTSPQPGELPGVGGSTRK